MISNREDLICQSFVMDTPVIIWEDVEVPMVPHGHWTSAQIDKAFATILELPSTLRQAETSFEEKSPSMIAANYLAKNLDDMIPTHLN
jgi:hypothetical protein